jgi:ATP diphosphatase
MSIEQVSVLDGVPADQPELVRALELQRRAAQVGFDWNSMPPVLAKIREELTELETEIAHNAGPERLQDELGDLLFAVANLARKLNLDPESALHGTNAKFRRRFGAVEQGLAKQGRRPQDASLAEMDALWEAAKHDES